MATDHPPISVLRGDAWSHVWRFPDIDLTGRTFRCYVKEKGGGNAIPLDVNVTFDGATDVVTALDAEGTSDLIAGRQYALWLQEEIVVDEPNTLVRAPVVVGDWAP